MATPLKDHDRPLSGKLIDISEKKFALVVSSWNKEVTELLYSGVYDVLIRHGAKKTNIIRKNVPGSFELSLGGQWMAQSDQIDAVICLGCIIQGETRHFEFICNAVSYGLTKVGLKYNKPVIFGVLTTNNLQQAMDRAGKKYGNKGEEAALSAIKMLRF